MNNWRSADMSARKEEKVSVRVGYANHCLRIYESQVSVMAGYGEHVSVTKPGA
jgi:hypothetical protein